MNVIFGAGPPAPGLEVPIGYISEEALAFSMTFTGETTASLGITPGVHTWTWGSGANADSLSFLVVPEPASLALLALGGLLLARRRRRDQGDPDSRASRYRSPSSPSAG
ncbi:MAG: PEP-CTERM sorting domain-containing protein [Planctomycetota bacterium]